MKGNTYDVPTLISLYTQMKISLWQWLLQFYCYSMWISITWADGCSVIVDHQKVDEIWKYKNKNIKFNYDQFNRFLFCLICQKIRIINAVWVLIIVCWPTRLHLFIYLMVVIKVIPVFFVGCWLSVVVEIAFWHYW